MENFANNSPKAMYDPEVPSTSGPSDALIRHATELGLPIDESTTWDVVIASHEEKSRTMTNELLGLPEDSTWHDINRHLDEQARLRDTTRRGLGEYSTNTLNLPNFD